MVDFNPSELEYLRLVLDSIIESETRQISQTEALLRAGDVRTKKTTQQVNLSICCHLGYFLNNLANNT